MLLGGRAGAAILEHDALVVAIMPFARAAVDDAVCRDAAEKQTLNAVRAQDRLKRGAVERADPVLQNIEVARLRRERRMDGGAGCAELEHSVLSRTRKHRRGRRTLAVVGREPDAHIADRNAGFTRGRNRIARALQHIALAHPRHVSRGTRPLLPDQIVDHVHDKQDRFLHVLKLCASSWGLRVEGSGAAP